MKRKQKEWINWDKSGEKIWEESFKTDKKLPLENPSHRKNIMKTNSEKIEIIKLPNEKSGGNNYEIIIQTDKRKTKTQRRRLSRVCVYKQFVKRGEIRS